MLKPALTSFLQWHQPKRASLDPLKMWTNNSLYRSVPGSLIYVVGVVVPQMRQHSPSSVATSVENSSLSSARVPHHRHLQMIRPLVWYLSFGIKITQLYHMRYHHILVEVNVEEVSLSCDGGLPWLCQWLWCPHNSLLPWFLFHYIYHFFFFSSRLVSVSRRRAHSRAVVFRTLHKGLRITRLCSYLFSCNMIDPPVVPATLLYPLLIPSSETPWPSPTALARALLLSSSFAAPLALLGYEVARHRRQQWTFTDRLPPTGSNQCLAGCPRLCPTGRPGA